MKPQRKDFKSDWEFVRARHEYNQSITNEANKAFDEQFIKSMKEEKTMAKKRKKSGKKKRKGTIPMTILKSRLSRLSRLIVKRGG